MYQDLPVIALTANTVSGARDMFRSEGFTEFIPKPIERTVLERVLRKVLPKDCIRYSAKPSAPPVEAVQNIPAAGPEPAKEAVPPVSPPDAPALPYDRLAQAGINVELGLDYCAGDEDFYREMLRMFSVQGAEKRAEIAALYERSNWTDYAVKVHALKSTSLTIGAEALSAQAKELELAGKRGDVGFIQAHHHALLCAHEELCTHMTGL